MTENARKRFLEPVYMNENMVLNAAAYLFSGILDSTSERNIKENTNTASGNIGGSFLGFAIGLKGQHVGNTSSQQETLRRFTVGGLHMEVLDELEVQGLITSIEDISGRAVELTNGDDGFFHARVILQPTEYWVTLQVLQISLPLITQIISNYSDLIVRNIPEDENSRIGAELLGDIEKYTDGIRSTIDRLVEDYFQSGSVEMMMWLNQQQILGVVDIVAQDRDPKTLLSFLTGGKYHVYGKISARVHSGQKLSLLQRTTFFQFQGLYRNWRNAYDRRREVPQADGSAVEALDENKNLESFLASLEKISRVVKTELDGPCVRMLAMSVCL